MSTLNAKHMADKLFTTRHNFHMNNVIASVEEQYQELLNQRKGPEAFEVSLMKTVPADVIEELQDDGFIIEELDSCFSMKLPEGVIIDDEDSDEVEEEHASDATGTTPANGTVGGPDVEAEEHSDEEAE